MSSSLYAKDGFNLAAFMAQSTPNVPSSARSQPNASGRPRQSLKPAPLTSRHTKFAGRIQYYNGNYEGDASMFGISAESRSGLHLIDTDSEVELAGDLAHYRNVCPPGRSTSDPCLVERLCRHPVVCQVMTPERMMRLNEIGAQIQANRFFQKGCHMWGMFSRLFMWFFYILLSAMERISNWSNCLWHGKTMFRSLTRRLLWWMTLAKYPDVPYFAMILLTAPLLFCVALAGLVLSLYCALKEKLRDSRGFISHRVF